MSTRQAQRLQMCEPVPGLQILVQLSNTPLVRTLIAIVTYHQLAIVKLSFLLGVSLLFLLLFGIIDLQRKFPDLSLPVIVSLAIWVLIALLELVLDTWFIYKNLYGPLSHYLRFFPNKKSPN